ncbi:MAG: YitT family protein [Erysipelotrichaceae bacterium]
MKKENIIDTIVITLGNFLLAAGVSFFILPNDILSGGLAGLAIALKPILGISPTMFINLCMIIFYIIGVLVLGKRFAYRTALSTILFPLFLEILSTYGASVHLTDSIMLASIYGGALMGSGIGLVFRVGGATGGMDIPPLIIHKYTNIPLPTLVLIVDALTVLLGALVYGIEAALVGLIAVWVSSYMVNKAILLGTHESKSIMIISDKYEEVCKEITQTMGRGVTIINAKGGYSNENKPVLMIAISKKQFPTLDKIVKRIDPNSFMIVSDAQEVHGLGFTHKEEI